MKNCPSQQPLPEIPSVWCHISNGHGTGRGLPVNDLSVREILSHPRLSSHGQCEITMRTPLNDRAVGVSWCSGDATREGHSRRHVA
eukprot:550455-Pyramimonas_sp.AAC.1